MEQAIKRHQRLYGRDHFDNEPRPQRIEPTGLINPEDLDCEQRMQKHCSLRVDDIDVYTRIVGYEAACNRLVETFVNRAKWVTLTHRFDVYQQAQERIQVMRKKHNDYERQWLRRIEEKGRKIIDLKQTKDQGEGELKQIASEQKVFKEAKMSHKELLQQTASFNFSGMPLLAWNQVEMKLQLQDLCKDFVQGDMEIDDGNSFSYAVIVQFPGLFNQQMLKTQFAPYDCVPSKLNPSELGNRDYLTIYKMNQQKYGKGMPGSTQIEQVEIELQQDMFGTQYLNSIEKALFGEFNNGQIEDFPRVRLKQAHWLPYVCFKPAISQEQMQQAALLTSEQNPQDQLARHFIEMVGVNDINSVNFILEAFSKIHYDQGKSNSLRPEITSKSDSIFSEQQQVFLQLFTECLKLDPEKELSQLPKHSLFECQQPLLFAQYLTLCLKAREAKTKLLYTLNAFRSIQKRIALELRELATRDRVAFDSQVFYPSENVFEGIAAKNKQGTERGSVSLVMEELIDIKQYRFNGLTQNQMWSTCPVLPKFHVTFGEPIERQEVSTEFEVQQDPKKDQAMRQLGRTDFYKEHASGCLLVTDDYSVAVMYDCSIADMQVLESELLKTISYYINITQNKVDRFICVKEILECEHEFQRAKLELAFKYLECYEHTCDSLEQQQLIQIIVDLMARRPRLNFKATSFKECYSVEIQLLETQTKLIGQFIKMQIDNEFEHNQDIRESLEKTYRLIYEQVDNKWQYFDNPHQELEARKLNEIGVQGEQDIEKLKSKDRHANMFQAKQPTVTLQQFAEMLGMPLSSLQMMLKEHLERDSVVRHSIHENVSFIKLQEGYPIFIQHTETNQVNQVTLVPSGNKIGILHLYESLSQVIRVAAVSYHALEELKDTHQPDNGLLSAMQDLVATEFLLNQLRTVQAENRGEQGLQSRDLAVIEDSSILGNPEKMLFHVKELVASAQDPELTQNPFVLTKLDLKTLEEFDFDLVQSKEFRKKISAIPNTIVSHDTIQQTKDLVQDLQTAQALQSILDGSDESLSDDEFAKKQKLHEQKKDKQYPRLKTKYVRPNIPSMLEITCNSVEVLRLRHVLVEAYHQRQALVQIFESQSKLLGKEPKVFFSDQFSMETNLSGGNNWKNYVDTGPATFIPTQLAIKEFDPTLTSIINFSDPEAFKALVCPLGLEEMRVVVRYEVLNLHLLIVGVRHNQLLLDNLQRQLAELNLLENGCLVSAPALQVPRLTGQSYFDNKRFASDRRTQILNTMSGRIARLSYNIIAKKFRPKEQVEQAFKKVKYQVADKKYFKVELGLRHLRTARMLLCYDYCTDVASQVYLDAVRIDLMSEVNQIRRRAFLLPPQQMIHKLPVPVYGEHNYALYNSYTECAFYDDQSNKIEHFWTLPSFQEIALISQDLQEFQKLNVTSLYLYDGLLQRPDLLTTDQKLLIKQQIPQFTQLSAASAQQLHLGRFCDFAEAPNVLQQPLVHYLFYFRNLQNLFDLEYFKSTLNSMANSVSELEQAVISGSPFWESPEGEQSDVQESSKEAETIVHKMANDKKLKIKLMIELDHIRDQFNEWDTQMTKLQLKEDLYQAGLFLHELAQMTYNSILVGLQNVQQSLIRSGVAQKENHTVTSLLNLFSHTDCQKVTYSNGFHVNQSVTALGQISVENNVQRPDYNNFFQATLPVMDLHALNPSEFNLVRGMYTAQSSQQKAYRGLKPFVGYSAKRDYSHLDYKLIGLTRDVRKAIHANILEVQSQSVQFAHENQNMHPQNYQYNLASTLEIINDQKQFQRHQIKIFRMKQALMILKTKKTLTTDIKQLQQLNAQFNETYSWKIMSQADEKLRHKKTQEQKKRAVQMFDVFHIEIDIYQREIQNYLILTAHRMLQRESSSLAKAFELNGKRLEVLVDVKQQFAATNDDRDKLNHLDIVNKVSSVQKLLTQMKNRMLIYRQLTGGEGIMIRTKDLQQIIEDFTRSIVKDGEVEMRTRCESLQFQIQTYEDLLYAKDQQIGNLEHKLQHAAQEMSKVVNARVFANSSQQTYELDKAARHLRLVKDNIFQMESMLTDRIHKNFQRDLTQQQLDLAEQKKKFKEYQVTLNSHMSAQISDNINSLDVDLKKLVSPDYKPDRNQTSHDYAHLLTGEARKQYKSLNAIQADGLQEVFKELDRLKRQEQEARDDVLAMQQLMRKQRMMQNFKWLDQQKQWQLKFDKMEKQLSSNTTLWEQLAESEKREQVLKQELQKSQESLVTLEKVLERLRDELNTIKTENQKLMNLKDENSKKQQTLENLQKQMEVVGNINLDKVLFNVATKDRQVETLKQAATNGQSVIDSIMKNQHKQLQRMQEKARQESIVKEQAILQLNVLKAELQVMQSGDSSSLSLWPDKRFIENYPLSTPLKLHSGNQSSFANLHQRNVLPTLNSKRNSHVFKSNVFKSETKEITRSSSVLNQNPSTSVLGSQMFSQQRRFSSKPDKNDNIFAGIMPRNLL